LVEQHLERKLTAILAADVVGYSRLMGVDEVGTLRSVKALRKELIEPSVAQHHGRIVKLTGDGILIEFASAVDAVASAIAVQKAMVRRNSDIPQDRRIKYRAGINIGDIIVEGDDIYGDGVNIAARLEGIAEPGGICISGTVYEHIRDKLPFAFTDRGEQTFRNIAHPVRVYALGPDALAAMADVPTSTETIRPLRDRWRELRWIVPVGAGSAALLALAVVVWLAAKPAKGPELTTPAPRLSMVVLPFTNLSGDPAQDYLADVLTEELTTSLARIHGGFVIARSTAFTYKGKPLDVKQVGRDLGVRYVLEGSEQRGGNRVRVRAQLIDAETGSHLWADQFDADRADLLQMQDEIVTRLARALQLQLPVVSAARVARTRAASPDAEDLALHCEAVVNQTPGGLHTDYGLCERALEIDPRNVRALAIMADKYASLVANLQSTDRQADIREADELVSRVLAIDPSNYVAHWVKAKILYTQKRGEEALVEAKAALDLNPSYIPAYAGICVANFALGRFEEVIASADTAIRLSPRDPGLFSFYYMKGISYFALRQDATAIDWLRRSAAITEGFPNTQATLAAVLALSGYDAEGRATLKRYLSLSGTRARTITEWKAQLSSDNPGWLAYRERLYEGLRKAGMPEE
jgi:adenylate cyclase